MYNTTTRSYTMEDASGAYSWIVTDLHRDEMKDMTDSDIYSWVDTLIKQEKENELFGLEDQAANKSYPCFGYTTAQVFNSADEYVAFKKQEIETDLSAEREHVFKYLKEWLEG